MKNKNLPYQSATNSFPGDILHEITNESQVDLHLEDSLETTLNQNNNYSIFITLLLIVIFPVLLRSASAQCTTGCNQTLITNTLPSPNPFSNTCCIRSIAAPTVLSYNLAFNITGGTLCIGPYVKFQPGGGGTWSGNYTVNNYGDFKRTMTLVAGQTFNNYGTFTGQVNLNGGTFINYSGASLVSSSFNYNSGVFTNSAGASSNISGGLTVPTGATFTNYGTFQLTNSLIVSAGATAILGGNSSLNNVSNNGTMIVSGIFNANSFNQGTGGVLTSPAGSQCNFFNAGSIQGQGTFDGINGLLLSTGLTPPCPSCLINGTITSPPGLPANQMSGLTLSAAGNTITGTVTNPGGSPGASTYLVLRKIGSAVTDLPTDYNNYPVGTVIGSSTVVAENSISNLSFTDPNVILTNGCNTYYYAVFAKNASANCGTYNKTISAGNSKSIVISSNSGTLSGSSAVCAGNPSSNLSLSGYIGSILRWESATSPFSSWTTISNTSNAYSPGILPATTQYRVVVNAGTGCSNAIATVITATVNPLPSITTTNDGNSCGPGTVTITATPGAGETIDWYSAPSGGTPLVSGTTSYTTPSISNTTIYYAQSRNTTTGCISTARVAINAIVIKPSITSFSPVNAGPGFSVIITGTNFTGATAVSFGGTAATSFTVNSATQITAVVGAGATGNVSVTTPCGTATLAGFTYFPAPTITSFTATSGYIGNTITITGTNFTGATNVNFGGTTAASFTVVSATSITAVISNGASGSVSVTTPGGTATKTGFTYINATIWNGIINNNWDNAGNWNNGIPATTSLAIIPKVNTTYPVLSSSPSINSLLLDTSAVINISGSNNLSVKADITSNGTIRGSGNLMLNGSSVQTISGKSNIVNITINNPSGCEIAGGANTTINISGTITASAGSLTTNGNLVLKSDITGSGRVGEIPVDGLGNTLFTFIGDVQVEQFYSARRAWRFISVTTTGPQTIKDAWQEGQEANITNPAGYGIQITGPNFPNGFDLYTSTASVKTYVPATNSWVGIASTNIPFTAGSAYMAFIRGDRTVNTFGQNPTSTILRTRGSLITGNQLPLTVNANQFTAINNPYVSAINFKNVSKINVDDKFYVWDPNLGALGAYQTFIKNGSGDYEIVEGGGSYGSPGTIYNEIQNGQAFFVYATGTTGTLSLEENDKSNGFINVSRYAGPGPVVNHVKQFRSRFYGMASDGTTTLLDAVLNQFNNDFSNEVDGKDAIKGMSFGENLSVKTSGKLLVVDRRKEIASTDTIFLNLSGLKAQSYKFEFIPQNMNNDGLSAFIEDNYLHTRTSLSLDNTTVFNFAIVNIPGSYAANRFRIVWYKVSDPSFAHITAERNGNTGVTVNWQVQNESGIDHYELEHSFTGRDFNKVIIKTPLANNNSTGHYNHLDISATKAANYYRVKAIKNSGQFFYSNIVMVIPVRGTIPVSQDSRLSANENTDPDQELLTEINVFPNPVVNKTLNIRFENQTAGTYQLQLVNQLGVMVFTKSFQVYGKYFTRSIHLDTGILPGLYRLKIENEKGQTKFEQLIIR